MPPCRQVIPCFLLLFIAVLPYLARLRGEVEIRTSEFRVRGDSPRARSVERPLTPTLSPQERGEGAHRARPSHPSTVLPLLITVTPRDFTLASNETKLPSFHNSMVTVSPG